jgi:hypothetical protein
MSKGSGVTLADIVDEAQRVIEKAREKGIAIRLVGGVGVRIHSSKFSDSHKALRRDPQDIDFVGYLKDFKRVKELFEELGYVYRKMAYALATLNRYFFDDPVNSRSSDVFFDEIKMCHTIDFRGRLELDYPTVTVADLLLGKLQIVKINEKDVKDAIVLLGDHDVGEIEKETINKRYIAELLSDDWGFYYTATTNLTKVRGNLDKYEVLTDEDRKDIAAKIDALQSAIEMKPKTLKWRLRARVGTRVQWYEEVEEVLR